MTVAILAVLLLTLNPALAQPNQPRTEARTTAVAKSRVAPRNLTGRAAKQRELEPVVIKAYMCAYALKYHTKPKYVMALGHIESRIESRKGKLEFRTWKTGLYFQPMGIHEDYCYKRHWPVDTLEGNIEAGARALEGIQSMDALKKRLKTYNSSFNSAYWSQIVKAVDRYGKAGVGGTVRW